MPQNWEVVLERMAQLIGAMSGTVVAFEAPGQAPQCWQSARVRDAVMQWMDDGLWHVDSMALKMMAPSAHFICKQDFVGREHWLEDPTSDLFRRAGIDHQLFLPLRAEEGRVALFSFERPTGEGRFPPGAFTRLDYFVPHLARAGRLTAQLHASQIEAAAGALHALGIPAAILSRAGRVGATNAAFERYRETIIDAAFGRLLLADPEANGVFQTALLEMMQTGAMARTVPVPAIAGRAALVLNLVSLQRTARDAFPGGDILLTVAEVGTARQAPQAHVLKGLFGLSPAEARVAIDLALGLSLSQAAEKSGLTAKTARTYLERIFHKTGTHRQAELVALLRAVQPPSA